MKEKIGLVLEGGGMRSLYTAGVLDYFIEQKIELPYVIGVSAGACMGVSYISKQLGRNKRVNTDYLKSGEFISFKKWILEGQLFNMDFIFDRIPNELDPFDSEAFYASSQEFVAGVTNFATAEPTYFKKSKVTDMVEMNRIIRASSSIPLLAPAVEIHNEKYYDGGIVDSIPVEQALKDGCSKLIIVLTRDRTYHKKKPKREGLVRRVFKESPEFADAVLHRYQMYQEEQQKILELEATGQALVIRPKAPVRVKRSETNREKLNELYAEGYQDAVDLKEIVATFLN